MLRTTLAAIAGALLIGAQAAAAPAQLDAGAALLAQLARQPVRPFSTVDFGRANNPQGRSVLVPQAEAERLLTGLRGKLRPGLVAFIGVTNNMASPKQQGVELVLAEGADQFDILRVAQTDGVNHGLETEDIVKELRAWDKEFGIDIWQAETDTVQLRLKRLPKDLPAFAERVYKFCPDIVEQGVGDVGALAKEIARTKTVFLWWD